MKRATRYALPAAITATLFSPVLLAQRPVGRSASLTVVTAGSEQALSLNGTTLSRPFGAALIDRLAVVGRYPGARGEQYYLVRGDVAGPCPSSYVVVHQRAGQTPLVSAPFGACTPGARAQVSGGRLIVSVPTGTPGSPPVRYAYAQGAVVPLDAAVVAALVPTGTILSCPVDEPAADGSPAELATALERDFPQEFRRRGTIAKLDITLPEMREMVARLACLSTRPGADPMVYKAAAPLFASKRYGRRAFDALDAVLGRTPGVDASLMASAKQFGAQMTYFVGRREPI